MRGTFRAENPDEIELSLTITMPLKHWVALKTQLSEKWPSWKLSAIIGSMVDKASERFYNENEVGGTRP